MWTRHPHGSLPLHGNSVSAETPRQEEAKHPSESLGLGLNRNRQWVECSGFQNIFLSAHHFSIKNSKIPQNGLYKNHEPHWARSKRTSKEAGREWLCFYMGEGFQNSWNMLSPVRGKPHTRSTRGSIRMHPLFPLYRGETEAQRGKATCSRPHSKCDQNWT